MTNEAGVVETPAFGFAHRKTQLSRMKVETVDRLASALHWDDVVELTKPRITLMVVLTAAAGAFMAAPSDFSPLVLLGALVATGLLASAASALNQVLESDSDALMKRTAHRPLPAGRLELAPVTLASLAVSVLSIAYLALRVNLLTAALGALTWGAYLFVYTPLKSRSPLSTWVGAVPGALPPLMGWAAASGTLHPDLIDVLLVAAHNTGDEARVAYWSVIKVIAAGAEAALAHRPKK